MAARGRERLAQNVALGCRQTRVPTEGRSGGWIKGRRRGGPRLELAFSWLALGWQALGWQASAERHPNSAMADWEAPCSISQTRACPSREVVPG